MTQFDWCITIAAVLLLLGAGFGVSKLSRRRTSEDFMVGGRRLPWWLAGTAMVAGASNCDSPLHQSAKIRQEGLMGGWFYWTQLVAAVWHSLVFSRLWRRLGVNTVVEFYALRYATRGGDLARVWSMVFGSLFGSVISLALGLLAMIKICQVLLDLGGPVNVAGLPVSAELIIVVVSIVLALGYSLVSGLLGVVAGDIVEFLVATVCSYCLLFFVYRAVGFSSGLQDKLAGLGRAEFLSFTPSLGVSFFVFFVVRPLVTVAGDNPLNQRFLAIRDERHAVLSGLWRVINHFFIRCWPWYICGLASVILLPGLAGGAELAYPELIRRYMPDGLRGLMFAGFLVAFMSSVCSAMHSAGIVFVNDFYRPFLVRHASDRHYLWAIRASMALITVAATCIALSSSRILYLVQVAMTVVAASGVVMLMRWFWWRINGWSDLASQVLALPVSLFFMEGSGRAWCSRWTAMLGGSADDLFGMTFLASVFTTTASSLIVLWLTPAEPDAKLDEFFARARPYGMWRPVARRSRDVVVIDRFGRDLWRYGIGTSAAFALLIGMGLVMLGRWWSGLGLLAVGGWASLILVRSVAREYEADRVAPVDDAAPAGAISGEKET